MIDWILDLLLRTLTAMTLLSWSQSCGAGLEEELESCDPMPTSASVNNIEESLTWHQHKPEQEAEEQQQEINANNVVCNCLKRKRVTSVDGTVTQPAPQAPQLVRVKRLQMYKASSQTSSSGPFILDEHEELMKILDEIITPTTPTIPPYIPEVDYPEESPHFIIKGKIQARNGVTKKVSMMVDSGAFANLIDVEFLRQSFFKHGNGKNNGIPPVRLFDLITVRRMDGALKGNEFESSEGVELQINFGSGTGWTESIKFFIIDKHSQNPPIILGMPFIRNHCDKLDWYNLRLRK